MTPMTREPVSSSVIVSVGYQPSTAALDIEFHSGAVYRYSASRSTCFAR